MANYVFLDRENEGMGFALDVDSGDIVLFSADGETIVFSASETALSVPTDLNVSGDLNISGAFVAAALAVSGELTAGTFATPSVDLALGSGATSIGVLSNVMKITGDVGGNTIGTITGGISGQRLSLTFIDALVSITDDQTATADSVSLDESFTSGVNQSIFLVHDGNKWFELARSASASDNELNAAIFASQGDIVVLRSDLEQLRGESRQGDLKQEKALVINRNVADSEMSTLRSRHSVDVLRLTKELDRLSSIVSVAISGGMSTADLSSLSVKHAADLVRIAEELEKLKFTVSAAVSGGMSTADLASLSVKHAADLVRIAEEVQSLKLALSASDIGAIRDQIKELRLLVSRVTVKSDRALANTLQIANLQKSLSDLEGSVSVMRPALVAAGMTSYSFGVGSKASGQDTDGAGTNGGGIVGGQAVDIATHMYDDSNGSVAVKVYDVGDDVWADLSGASALTGWAADYQLLPDAASEAIGDCFAVIFPNRFCSIVFDDLSTGGGAVATWGGDGSKYQYSTGQDTWSDLTVFDNTDLTAQDGLRTLQRTGSITFVLPSDAAKATYDGVEGYCVRCAITAAQLSQTPIIDLTAKDEPMVGIPDEHTFHVPSACRVESIRVEDMSSTPHDQPIKFICGEFTSVEPQGENSLSSELTFTASEEVMFFDLSANKPALSAGGIFGLCITDDGGSTDNPVLRVTLNVELR